jgi:hypothetical protein
MPIDFAAVAARFADQVALEGRRVVLVQRALATTKVLTKRRDAGRAVEQATRMFPVVLFYDGAVTMQIGLGQRSVIGLTTPRPSFPEHLWRGVKGFFVGLAGIVEPFRSDRAETAIARTAAEIYRALAYVEHSLATFQQPQSAPSKPGGAPITMFERSTSASDLIGLAALGFRALDEASRKAGEIEVLTGQIERTLNVFGGPEKAKTAATPGAESAAPAASLTDRLGEASLGLAAAISVVGVVPQLVSTVVEGAMIHLRVLLLDELRSIERSVLDLRDRLVLGVVEGVLAGADRAVDIVNAAQSIAGANIVAALDGARVVGRSLIRGILAFVRGIRSFLGGVVRFLTLLPGVLKVLVDFDLLRLLGGGVKGTIASAFAGGKFSLGDTLTKNATEVNVGLARSLWRKAQVVATAPVVFGLKGVLARIAAEKYLRRVRRVLDALFPGWGGDDDHRITVPEAPGKLAFKSDFPRLSSTIFGDGRAELLLDQINGLERSLDTNVAEALRSTRDGLEGFTAEFQRKATEAAALRDRGRLERAAAKADVLADRVFGGEVGVARKAVADRDKDTLALAFESWLATGGFVLIGEVIPFYVEEVARLWREKVEHAAEPPPITPTSPHILQRRATLGKVRVPRMTLHVPAGRQLDAALADEVTQRFGFAVDDAYRSGARRLTDVVTAPGG